MNRTTIMAVSREQVLDALRTVREPEKGKDIVRLNMVKNLEVSERLVSFTVVLKSPTSEFAKNVESLCREAIHERLGTEIAVSVDTDSEMISLGAEVEGGDDPKQATPGVQNVIAVASGKGGVGKSTVAVNMAVALARKGYDVGLVDTDIYGPSIPTMLGLEGQKPKVNEQQRIVPLAKYGLKVLSMGFMVDPKQAVIWRGPMVSKAIRQFLGQTDWGELDYLVLDLPPGTGDIQLTIVQTAALTGAIIVSTPQKVALADARKGVAMFEKVNVPVLGIIENMSYFSPPDLPDRKYYLFGEGGAHRLAEELAVPFLGEVPIEQELRETGDDGTPIVVANPESRSAKAFSTLATESVRQIVIRNAEKPPTEPVEILYR